MGLLMILWPIIWIACAVIAGYMARSKNRSFLGWFLMSFFLTPLVIVVLAVLNPLQPPADTKKCPKCAETIMADAKVCRFCGEEFSSLAD